MDTIQFVIGSERERFSLDSVAFTGTRDGQTLRFIITRTALEELVGAASHTSTILEMFQSKRDKILMLAAMKVPADRLYEDQNYLITASDVLIWPGVGE